MVGMIFKSINVDGSNEINSGFSTEPRTESGTCKQVNDFGSCSRKLWGDMTPSEQLEREPNDSLRVEGGRRGTTNSTPLNLPTWNVSNEGGSLETNDDVDISVYPASKWIRDVGSSTLPFQR